MLTFDFALVEGGPTVGILDSSAAWFTSENHESPGEHRGHLANMWSGGRRRVVALARASRPAASIRLDLREASVRIERR